MRGDFSRVTFRPEKHFSAVLLQQGRVQLDAEFNEQVAIEGYRDQATARDVIGRAGAPIDGGGFAITVASMLRGIAVGDDAWAVGEDGTVLRWAGGTESWTIVPVQPGTGRLNAIGVAGASGWAVGDAATILELTGVEWMDAPAPEGVVADLHGVHAEANGAWAVGAAGTVLFWNGSEWERQARNVGVTSMLRDVHFADDIGVAVGDDGTILATADRGRNWTVQTVPEGAGDLCGVSVADAEHVWAVGTQGTMLFFDGSAWARQSALVTTTLRAVVLTSDGGGVTVGDGGIALSLEGGAWRQEPTGVDVTLHALASRPGGEIVAAGDDITLIRSGDGWEPAPALPADEGGARGRTLAISAGDFYVDGVRCENERTVTFARQPEPPLDPAAFPPGQAGVYGVFLQVQEQLLTATEREELREVALGGPDTATRTRTVWQAGLVELGGETDPTCADVAARSPADPPRGRLRARAVPAAVSTSECIVPPNGGYRRLENQLYRVEIHEGSAAGTATFTWSRDNGSVIARLEDVTTDAVGKTIAAKVPHTGRDANLGFGPEQLVELTDGGRLLRGEPGELLEVQQILGTTLMLSNPHSLTLGMGDFPVNPIVRRWDGRGTVELGKWIELEDGVFVEFADGPNSSDSFRPGDYWTIPARTLSGRVEWPQTGGVPRFEEHQGSRLRAAPLAIVKVDGDGVWSDVRDCRRRFPALTDLVHLYYVGGDGQEIKPPVPLAGTNLVPLDRPLQVGVVNGRTPVTGEVVEFQVVSEAGAGKVAEPGGSLADVALILTDDDGVATCEWRVDGATRTQVVEARLRDPRGQSPPQVVRFNAQLSAAEWVAYDGSDCRTLAAGTTVDAAIRTLAHITRIFPLTGSGEDVMPGESVEIRVLVADECGPIDGATVSFAPGDGTPDRRGTGTIDQVQATTVNGVAGCRWTPDAATMTQDLIAMLIAVPGPGVLHMPNEVRFVANLSVATGVAYDGSACATFAPATNVQEALDLLVTLPRLYHRSGDGSHAAPNQLVRLEVGVASDCGPDTSVRRVQFAIVEGDGFLEAVGDEGIVSTLDGVAGCDFRMGDAGRHLVQARLVQEPESTFQPPVFFTITRVDAQEVRYSPGCTLLQQAEANTVQDALTVLCAAIGGEENDAARIVDVRLAANQQSIGLDTEVGNVDLVNNGLEIVCDRPMNGFLLGGSRPPLRLVVDVPYPVTEIDQEFWGANMPFGFQPIVLQGDTAAGESSLFWKANDFSANWLMNNLFPRLIKVETFQVVLHVEVLGNFIVSLAEEGETAVFLDADLFATARTPGEPALEFPSGDGRRGGKGQMWFRLFDASPN